MHAVTCGELRVSAYRLLYIEPVVLICEFLAVQVVGLWYFVDPRFGEVLRLAIQSSIMTHVVFELRKASQPTVTCRPSNGTASYASHENLYISTTSRY